MAENTLQQLKFSHKIDAITARLEIAGEPLFFLVPVGHWIIENEALVQLMTQWRTSNRDMYFSRFPETTESMKNYLINVSIRDRSTILFIIEDQDGAPYGHIGIKNVAGREAEIDSVVRSSELNVGGLMDRALTTLMDFCEVNLGIRRFTLEVISYNERAITFYTRNGFQVLQRHALFQICEGETMTHGKVLPENANVDYFSLKLIRHTNGADQ